MSPTAEASAADARAMGGVVRDSLPDGASIRAEAVGAFLHEVNGALAAACGFSAVTQRALAAQDSDRAEDAAARVSRNLEKVRRLAEGLGRLESLLHASPSMERVDAAALVAAVQAEAETDEAHAGEDAGAARAEPLAPFMVEADPFLLRLILTELLENARRHAATPDVPPPEWHFLDEGEQVVIVLRDHGPGLPPDRLLRPETPFGPGAGAGLACASIAARLLSGRLEAEAPAGGGACLRLVLPAPRP